MASGASAAWAGSAQISKRAVLLARASYGDGTKFIGAASGPIFSERKQSGEPIPSQIFDGAQYPITIVEPFPVSTSGNEIRDGKIQTDSTEISIDGFSEIMADPAFGAGDDFGFEGREIEIVIWVPGIATWAGCAPFKKGLMRGFSQRDDIVTITVLGQKAVINIEIPQDLLSDSDAADPAKGLPELSRGKTIPYIQGDHRHFLGDDSKSLDTASTVNNLVPALDLGVDSTGQHRWQISNGKMDTLNVEGDDSEQQHFWGKDPITGRFVRLASTITVVQNTAAGCIVSHPAEPQYFDHHYAIGTPDVSDFSSARQTPFADAVLQTDKAFNAASTGSLDDTTAQNEYIRTKITFPTYDNLNMDILGGDGIGVPTIDAVDVMWYGFLTITGAADVTLNVGFDAGSLIPVAVEPTNGGIYPAKRLVDPALLDVISEIERAVWFELIANEGLVGGKTATLDIYEVYKRITFTPGIVFDLHFGGIGAEYTVARAGHAEGTAVGLPIKNAAGAIEAVLRDLLGTTDIFTDGFDTASGLVDVELALGLINQAPAFDRLAAMAFQSRSLVHQKNDGDWTMTVIEKTYSAADFTVDWGQIRNQTVTISPLEDIVTKALTRFGDSAGNLTGLTAAVEDATMRTKYNVTAEQSFLQFVGNLIANGASALNRANFALDFWKQPHRFVNFEGGLEYTVMGVGDIIKFEKVPRKYLGLDITIENTIAGQKIYEFFMIIDDRRTADSVAFDVFQLHEVAY